MFFTRWVHSFLFLLPMTKFTQQQKTGNELRSPRTHPKQERTKSCRRDRRGQNYPKQTEIRVLTCSEDCPTQKKVRALEGVR